MTHATDALATWWSYAEADSTILGIVVAVIGIAAVGFVATRMITGRRRR